MDFPPCAFCKSEDDLHAFYVCNENTDREDEGYVVCGSCLGVLEDMRDTLSDDLSEYRSCLIDERDRVPA